MPRIAVVLHVLLMVQRGWSAITVVVIVVVMMMLVVKGRIGRGQGRKCGGHPAATSAAATPSSTTTRSIWAHLGMVVRVLLVVGGGVALLQVHDIRERIGMKWPF